VTHVRFATLVSLWLLLVTASIAAAQPPGLYIDPGFMPHRERMGFEVQPMAAQLREHFGAPPDQGILVTSVLDGGAADRAGLDVGDVIVSAGGTVLRQPVDLVGIIGKADAGAKIEIKLFRDGEEHAVSVEAQGEPTPWVDPEHWVKRV